MGRPKRGISGAVEPFVYEYDAFWDIHAAWDIRAVLRKGRYLRKGLMQLGSPRVGVSRSFGERDNVGK